MALPRFVVLKSNHNKKFLRYKHEDPEAQGYLEFNGDEVLNPYTKMEVEAAKGVQGLVHLRCCYNNKYWVRSSNMQRWIVGGADEPEEDQSKWSCTLFKPIPVDGDEKSIRFFHVQLGHFASLSTSGAPLLVVSENSHDMSFDVCAVVDIDSMVILPKIVVFKGDNGKYLEKHPTDGGLEYLKFRGDQISNTNAWHEVITVWDGSIQIKSKGYNDKLWCFKGNWVRADTYNYSDWNTFFWPIKVDNNIVAIKSLASNNFCKRLSIDNKNHYLNAALPTITWEARMEVQEPVISRQIYNVNFNLNAARIYNDNFQDVTDEIVSNETDESITSNLLFSYEDTKSSTWNANVSFKLSFASSIRAGIPVVMEGKAKIRAEFKGEMNWGETVTTKTKKETSYFVVVPPHSRRRVTLVVRMGSCDVPFSYTQCDTLYDGRRVVYEMNDGLYTGANYSKIDFKVTNEE